MRLHRLEVQALQAFAGTVAVDFDALSEAGLFLLHGETGAGKTTLLDAVCFALYGKLPGARGADARERADLAAPDVPTRVVLELTLRGERLRITRTPKQERAKQRGEGTTTVAATVRLEAIEPGEPPRTLALRVEEVQHELDRLLGMSREQFCQVVLLPQGRFATFLHARSDEREELLARLFGTERFEQAEAWLSDRRRRADEALRGVVLELRDVASRLSQVLGGEPPEGWEDAPATLAAWADEAQVVADAERAAAEGVCTDAAATRARADAALAAVRRLLEARARHARAVQELADFEAAGSGRAADAARLARGRAAAPVVPLARLAEAAAATARSAADHASAALTSVADATDGTAAATGSPSLGDTGAPGSPAGAVTAALADPAALRAAAATKRTAAGEVRGLAPEEAQLQAQTAVIAEVEAEATSLRARIVKADAWLDAVAGRIAAAEADAEAARFAVARRAEHAAAAEAAGARVAAARSRDAAAGRAAAGRAAVSAATEAEQTLRERWLALREARLDGMAAELAAMLDEDAPCPVCGSVEHPEPAAHLMGGGVTAAQEAGAKADADAARVILEQARAALAEEERAHAAAVAVAGDRPLGELEDAAEGAARLAAATAGLADGAEAADAALADLLAQRDRVEAGRGTAAASVAALDARADELRAGVVAVAARLGAALAGAATVAERVTALEARAAALDRAAAAVEAADTAAVEAAEASARATAAAGDAGFVDLGAALAAALDPRGAAVIEHRIRVHDDGIAERRALVTDPDLLAAVEAPDPDEPAAMAAARAAAEADADASQALERVRSRAEGLLALRRDLGGRLAEHGPAAEEAATIRAVATLVDGTSSQNRKRMRLRAYVLAARLEEIAAAASERLGRMSDGRFTLALDDERASHGRRSGLGLRVVDGWTGRDRAPSTLSGGETFQASLALALGLADVVAAEAGGARLETLFVDEGFGSLDEGALDNALEVLDRLREGGRAVGVVSHVPELRQRITAQVHVIKERAGSRVVQSV